MTRRLTPFALALLALSCRGGATSPAPIGPELGDAAPALDASPEEGAAAARDGGGQDDPGDAGTTEPASYLAYVAEAERRCKPKDPQESTWGMVRDSVEYLGCHAGIISANVARLPPGKRALLLDADPASPRGARPEPVGSLWSTTVEAVCGLNNARLWYRSGTSMAGTMCHITRRLCFEAPDLGFGFLVQAWVSGQAREAADHVRARVAQGRQARSILPAWERYSPLARGTAPFVALPSRECAPLFRLGDADWLALERDLSLVESGPPRLAAALCGAWPELAAALGGPAPCAASLTTYQLSFAAHDDPSADDDPRPAQDPDSPAADQPPPGDPDLIAELRPLRERCAQAPSSTRCFADARLAEETGAHLPFARRLARWVGDLCSLPDVLLTLSVASDTYHPWFSRATIDPSCAATADLLQVFALRRLAASTSGGATAFARHLAGRTAWGQAMKDKIAEALRTVTGPCPDRAGPCSAGTPAERARVADLLRRILAEAAPLTAAMCKTEGLAGVMGGSQPCAEDVERWLFGFGPGRT